MTDRASLAHSAALIHPSDSIEAGATPDRRRRDRRTEQPLPATPSVELFSYLDAISPLAVDALLEDLAKRGDLEAIGNALEAGCADCRPVGALLGDGQPLAQPKGKTLAEQRHWARRRCTIVLTLVGIRGFLPSGPRLPCPADAGPGAGALGLVSRWLDEAAPFTPGFLQNLLALTIADDNLPVVRMLLAHGIDPEQLVEPNGAELSHYGAGLGGFTPLCYAARRRQFDAFLALLPDRPRAPAQVLSGSVQGGMCATLSPLKLDDIDILFALCRQRLGDATMTAILVEFGDAVMARAATLLVPWAALAPAVRPLALPDARQITTMLAAGALVADNDRWRAIVHAALPAGASYPLELAGKSFWESLISCPVGDADGLCFLLGESFDPAALRTLRRMLADGALAADAVAGGMTLLQHAACSDNLALAEILIEHGADPTRRTLDGKTCVALNAANHSSGTVALLIEAALAQRAMRGALAAPPA